MPELASRFDFYLEELFDQMQKGVRQFQIDKQYLKTEWGSLTEGLVFFHKIFERMSSELGLKFIIQTNWDNPQKFDVYWLETEEKRTERGTSPW